MKYRNKLGQFASSLWSSLSRNQKQALVVMIVCAAVPLGSVAYEKVADVLHDELIYVAAPRAYAEIIQESTVDEMKADVLDKLAKCESGGKETTIVFDTNGKASVGNYQWQIASFQYYYAKMTGRRSRSGRRRLWRSMTRRRASLRLG
jgi:hypothetical protein